VRKILMHLPQPRQTLLFSATMPDDIEKLAREILLNPVTVQIDHLMPIATVTHALFPVEQHLKTPLLMELLRRTDTESVLVFTRTKHRAKRLAEQLERARYRVACLQGNLSQNRRQEALDGFRDGIYQILVATDIAARGLDVTRISHVINYDIPDTADAYTHRIGRTGRAAKTGDAFTLVAREDYSIVSDIERVLGAKLERRSIEGFNYNTPAPARSRDEFVRRPRESQGRRPSTGARTSSARPKAAPKSEMKPSSVTRVAMHGSAAAPPAGPPPPSGNSRRMHGTSWHPRGAIALNR